MDKKKGWGLLRPRPPSGLFNPDVLQFAGVFGECPLPTFGRGNYNITGLVFAVDALVVIPSCARYMEGTVPTSFDHNLAVGPCHVPQLGDPRVRQTQFAFRARVVGEDGVLSHLDTHRPIRSNHLCVGHDILGNGNGHRFGGCWLRCLYHRRAFLSFGHNDLSYPVLFTHILGQPEPP
jgi:hypothetical protein